jgi:hypothetical protein
MGYLNKKRPVAYKRLSKAIRLMNTWFSVLCGPASVSLEDIMKMEGAKSHSNNETQARCGALCKAVNSLAIAVISDDNGHGSWESGVINRASKFKGHLFYGAIHSRFVPAAMRSGGNESVATITKHVSEVTGAIRRCSRARSIGRLIQKRSRNVQEPNE